MNGLTTTEDYINGIQYAGSSLDFIQTEEGKAVYLPSSGTYEYVYYLGDNLGNTRITFGTKTGSAVVYQKDDYYPFGMEVPVSLVSSPKNEYLYNRKELQEETQEYDYGARFYDPVVGRFTRIDPVAEHFPWLTSYQYASNNPSSKIDLDGLEGIFIDIPLLEDNAIIPRGTSTGSGYSPENIAKAGGDVARTSENANRAANFQRGNNAEAEQLAKNGLTKNTQPIRQVDPKTGKEETSIPDALENDGKKTVEIKYTKYQARTKQLRVQEKYSNNNGENPELLINKDAKISKPLQNSTFDIKTYQTAPVTLQPDATKTVITPIAQPAPQSPPPPQPCGKCGPLT